VRGYGDDDQTADYYDGDQWRTISTRDLAL
jgi:hypothetical protein